MLEKCIEIILFRQITSYLSIPAFIQDSEGTVIFYNEAAENILGLQFSETGEITEKKWTNIYCPQEGNGDPINSNHNFTDLFDISTMNNSNSNSNSNGLKQEKYCIRDNNHKLKKVQAASIPIINILQEFKGRVTFFQETHQ